MGADSAVQAFAAQQALAAVARFNLGQGLAGIDFVNRNFFAPIQFMLVKRIAGPATIGFQKGAVQRSCCTCEVKPI
jgi:hypothetical protein